jgi:hypothetical protein
MPLPHLREKVVLPTRNIPAQAIKSRGKNRNNQHELLRKLRTAQARTIFRTTGRLFFFYCKFFRQKQSSKT